VRFNTKKEIPSRMHGEKRSGKEKGLTVGGGDLKHEGKGVKKRKSSKDTNDSRRSSASDRRSSVESRSPRSKRGAKKILSGGASSDKKGAKGRIKEVESSMDGKGYHSKDKEEDPMKGTFMTQNEGT